MLKAVSCPCHLAVHCRCPVVFIIPIAVSVADAAEEQGRLRRGARLALVAVSSGECGGVEALPIGRERVRHFAAIVAGLIAPREEEQSRRSRGEVVA